MRLLALTTSEEEGGAEWHLLVTLAAARARGYGISAGLPHYPATARLREELATAGADIHSLPIGRAGTWRGGSYWAILRDAVAVFWILSRVRPDVVLFSLPTPEATPGGMLACALARVPVTAVFLLVRGDMLTTKRRQRLYRLLARGQQRWVCLSDHNRAILAANFGVSRQRISVVRNGTRLRAVPYDRREEIRASLGLRPDATVVLTTARLSGQKEHRLIVEALPGLVARDPGIVFVWAGDGPLRDTLARSLKETGLERHVLLLGRRDDVPELLAAADLFLMPSRDEGGAPPFALAEAMNAGVPAIVSDAGALTEIIEDKTNGLVFSCGDADDLAAVVAWALSHREQVARMAVCAREQAARNFTLKRMTDEIIAQIEA